MSNLSHANGKDNLADHPVVVQLRKDIDQIKRDLPDHQLRAISSVTFIERTDKGLQALRTEMSELRADNAALKEMVGTVIATTNNILQAVLDRLPPQEP